MKHSEELDQAPPVQNVAQRSSNLLLQVISRGIVGSIVLPLLSGLACFMATGSLIKWAVREGHISAGSTGPIAFGGIGVSILIAYLIRTGLKSVK
jgi:hypothetical protein